MQKFQYLIFNKFLSEYELNILGAEGWDLVGFSVGPVMSSFTWNYIFKRPV
jgi:hypothetical protein